MNELMQIKDLCVTFEMDSGPAIALESIDLRLHEGKTMGLVGESGCGKTLLARTILQLHPSPPAQISGGEILFKGMDLASAGEISMQRIRGNDISMIFQEPMTALNPVLRTGEQVAEVLRLHRGQTKKQARQKALELYKDVGIAEADKRFFAFPHQLSGGMRQRVGIAMALACDPDLVLADEPTTALDVTIQAHILDLLRRMQKRTNAAVLFITHDLGLVAHNCSRVAVMYAGWIVEEAEVDELFHDPQHPYTKGLLASLPNPEQGQAHELVPIPGTVPDLKHLPHGCLFHPRCPERMPVCETEAPPETHLPSGRRVKCWLYRKNR